MSFPSALACTFLTANLFYLTDSVAVQTSRSMILFQVLMTGSLPLEATNRRLILHSFFSNKGEGVTIRGTHSLSPLSRTSFAMFTLLKYCHQQKKSVVKQHISAENY